MPRVVPRDVVAFVDNSIPVERWDFVGNTNVGSLAAVIELLTFVPDELLQLDSASFTALVAARSELASAVSSFRNLKPGDRGFTGSYTISMMAGYGNLTPLAVIRRELAKCPDSVPRADLPDLVFIKDPQLRDTLRRDLSSAAMALTHDEWKAATVLAGSVAEALLLWALDSRTADLTVAITKLDALGAFKTLRKPDAGQLERWDLAQYTVVARDVNEIGDETAKAVDLMREFRNLIHPGRVKRTQQTCTRGTAHIAFGGLQRVIDDLAQRHPTPSPASPQCPSPG